VNCTEVERADRSASRRRRSSLNTRLSCLALYGSSSSDRHCLLNFENPTLNRQEQHRYHHRPKCLEFITKQPKPKLKRLWQINYCKNNGFRRTKKETCVSFCNQPKTHFGFSWVRPWDNHQKTRICGLPGSEDSLTIG